MPSQKTATMKLLISPNGKNTNKTVTTAKKKSNTSSIGQSSKTSTQKHQLYHFIETAQPSSLLGVKTPKRRP
jgi:hypothetical protein